MQHIRKVLHYLILICVTLIATSTMAWVSQRNNQTIVAAEKTLSAPLLKSALPRPLISLLKTPVEMCELSRIFSGKIQPWEFFDIPFEVTGRVEKLGTDATTGLPLDDGSRVTTGQMLAQIVDTQYTAQHSESSALLEQAKSDLKRAERLRKTSPGVLTDAEYQQTVTSLAQAKAKFQIASKNLADTLLRSPVEAVISRRMINIGESAVPNKTAFQLVQLKQLLLTVYVPETNITELLQRQEEVQKNIANHSDTTLTKQDKTFQALISLEGTDRFGKAWEPIQGEIYRIAQVADPQTGLFEVEIQILNKEGTLRPGMVATAKIITKRLRGYKIPESAVSFRKNESYLFTVQEETAPLQVMYFKLGKTQIQRAIKVPILNWTSAGKHIVIPADSIQLKNVIVRGQKRLTDQQLVRPIAE